MTPRPIALAAAVTLLSWATSHAHEETLVSVPSRPDIEQKFLLVKPEHPVAAVILLAGGSGGMHLSSLFCVPAIARGDANFLVRTRTLFADRGLVVAVIDSPSDHMEMNAVWRMSRNHARDIHAVVQALKTGFNLPVWVVGTSMGTFSAANAAIRLGPEVSGLVLASSITRSPKKWDIYVGHPEGVIDMDLFKITVPTLIVAHKEDECDLTLPADAEKLKSVLAAAAKVEVKYFAGAKMPAAKPCKAQSAHGYYGIENEVVAAIADFIKSNP